MTALPQLRTDPLGGGPEPVRSSSGRRSQALRSRHRIADRTFRGLAIICGVMVIAVAGFVAAELLQRSLPSIQHFGWKFLVASHWDPVTPDFGVLPFIYGTAVSSAVALCIAVPLGVGLALFVTEISPRRLRSPIAFATELLAAIPSVIYGMWAIFVLVPLMRQYVEPWTIKYLGWTGLFSGPPYGIGMLTAGVVLSIMVVPIISSISREVIAAVPRHQREAALALGATRWEMVRIGVLQNARIGIIGAVILGLGRALGETMAVTMVIGNVPQIARSLLAPADTMASVIANQFTEATGDLYLSALIEVGLVLFVITIVVNAAARLLVWSVTRGVPARVHAQ
jgi:phosphate transport system permease protein